MANSTNHNPIALSFDVEDWFNVRNMRTHIHKDSWEQQEYRVEVGLNFILEELSKRNIKATFFILGWVAEKSKNLVKRIQQEGHEIASHGHSHTPIDLMTPSEFRHDLIKSMAILEKITGEKIRGFRAPSFSITPKTAWAIDIMEEVGLEYDSSIFVTSHPDYGIKNFPEELTNINGLLEVPMTRGEFLGQRLPINGGGYFRLFPYAVTKTALEKTLSKNPLVMYFHPWEFDENQPRIALPPLKRFRHYVGLNANRRKFIQLLNDFKFCTIRQMIYHRRFTYKAQYEFRPILVDTPALTH